jgi:hypothetical protein
MNFLLDRPCPYPGSFSSVPLSSILCSRAVNSSTIIMEAAVFSETSAFLDRPRHRYILENSDLAFSIRKSTSSVVSFVFNTDCLPLQFRDQCVFVISRYEDSTVIISETPL